MAQKRSMLLSLFIIFSISACGSSTLVASPTYTPTAASTVMATSIPTATAIATVPCPGTVNNSELQNLEKVVIPDNVTVVNFSQGAIDGMAYSFSYYLVNLCNASMTPDSIHSFFSTHMSMNGWTSSSTFPYDGNISAACKDSYCWNQKVANDMTIAVALENVQSSGTNTLYAIRFMRYNTTPRN